MSERVILHSDMNCFYASVEMLHHPEFAGMPLAVGGDPEARHGIVLTANYIAKKKRVKTGMALWQAKQVCPEIIFVPPRMDLYLRFSQMAREIYSEYTDKIEPYGIDEAWLDVSGSGNLKGRGMTIAREISHRIKYELGVTVSIGISWNKIYAKLGSDYKKPDAITELNRENYKDRIWQLPASDLLYVGRQTNKKLQKLGIRTIGQLAESDEKSLESHFGKKGTMKGLKAGKAKVTITLASGKKQVISITVQKTTVRTTKITGLKSRVTVARNKKLALKPVISPITSQEKVTYSSSNKKIVTVNSKGVITGKKKGTAYITVKSGKIRKKVKVVVK